jgi:hypothetical protein
MNSDTDYAHRLNADGTFDSICLHCYLTVMQANTEQELAVAEAQHSCPPDSILARNIVAKFVTFIPKLIPQE